MSKAVKEIKDKLSAVFEAEPAVGLVYLFGSQASGKTGPMSDYDFGIYFTEKSPIKRGQMVFYFSSEISKMLATNKVDVHSMNDIESPELKYQIISSGKIIFEREPNRLLLEPRVFNEYFDFIYLLKKYNLTRAK
ncbi:hypothetical protein A3G55_00610 [Candidatus Giovannonibacteria bacterium RIFCSPLOWO2_12_FULL_44_25]|uniref:Polymerase beta nucleotidyltransferase domain-containing protein n=2 Tax=Candidatus Giovannoniibacteriota TaxID=1752738 RepID=A0A1F5WAK5_9BACT|nr:MAG: Nucleotidyltransferase [Parcubacteria group bacterium GW2011_GWC1_44_10]KKT60436.1 MAG: Nucleotidyltransferase [Candidatus Giovannonibacteria bacterium GW2011_GWA1_44_25]KKU30294.1 MAG: Nucleotidyltransferase [Candidatus Giovannonibacteria bacterium GW2011_GWB1_46_20]OGF50501.1 MAG: hypothetical protein A2120_02545 [Candidatus Giovannonibacteria bacterium GWA2_45_15]OGF59634.1 MAG: hypothetical protein A2W40_04440 [Candidatus Giovannonibacteria bacterium RIFCSPHIGHO2_01_45_12]OGF60375.